MLDKSVSPGILAAKYQKNFIAILANNSGHGLLMELVLFGCCSQKLIILANGCWFVSLGKILW
jgi:hypothetical protein